MPWRSEYGWNRPSACRASNWFLDSWRRQRPGRQRSGWRSVWNKEHVSLRGDWRCSNRSHRRGTQAIHRAIQFHIQRCCRRWRHCSDVTFILIEQRRRQSVDCRWSCDNVGMHSLWVVNKNFILFYIFIHSFISFVLSDSSF